MKWLKHQHGLPTLAGASLLFLLGILQIQSVAIEAMQNQSEVTSDEQATEASLQVQTQLNLWEKIPSLGFDNLIADWVFLQFLQYFGDDAARNEFGYELSPEYFEAIIPHDPYFAYFYFFLSGSTSLYAGQPERTVQLITEGVSHMTPEVPEGYKVWRYKGTDELLFLGNAEAAQASFQTAADWASQSDAPEAEVMAQVSQRTADYLEANPVSRRAQVDAWASILGNSFDENTQQLAIERIEALGGRVNITEEGQIQIGYPQQD
jgi:hypothetical protein